MPNPYHAKPAAPAVDHSKLIDLSYLVGLATAAQEPKVLSGYRPFILAPQADGSLQPISLTPDYEAPLPDYILQEVIITELESYIAYIQKFQTPTTAIFAIADARRADFEAVLDYHKAGPDGEPLHAGHRVNYTPDYSPEFQAWMAINEIPLSQEMFLNHLRKWGDTIQNLSDADLIEMASSLDFTSAGQFSSYVERVKGGRKLLINETVEGTAQLKGKTVTVPDGLLLDLPVFTGGRSYGIGADLLYRPQSGALRITVELRRAHRTIRQAVKDIVADVKEGTGIEPFMGRRCCP